MKAKHIIILITLPIMGSILISGKTLQEAWEVPANYVKMKNPTDTDKESLNIGKNLYAKHCRSCHGKEGLGDGPKSAELETPSGDFSTAEFQAQSDGAIFYKSTAGRDDMPSFEKKTSDEDRWLIIRFLRTMAE